MYSVSVKSKQHIFWNVMFLIYFSKYLLEFY